MTAEQPAQDPDAVLTRIVSEADIASTGSLIRAARSGDGSAFGELCRRLTPWLEAVVAQNWRGHDPAFGREDLMATVLRRAFEHRADFDGEQRAQLRAWLRRIVGRAMLDVIRAARAERRDRRREVPLAEIFTGIDDEDSLVVDTVVRREDLSELRRRLDRLAPIDRDVLEAVYHDGKSLGAFADQHGIDREAAKKRHQRALRRLQELLPQA